MGSGESGMGGSVSMKSLRMVKERRLGMAVIATREEGWVSEGWEQGILDGDCDVL